MRERCRVTLHSDNGPSANNVGVTHGKVHVASLLHSYLGCSRPKLFKVGTHFCEDVEKYCVISKFSVLMLPKSNKYYVSAML